MKEVNFFVNGNQVHGKEGESLLVAIRRAGYYIPSICYHDYLKPYGACRLCLIEIEKKGKKKITTSCNYPVIEGIVINLDTEKVVKNRKMIIELLLSRAPSASILNKIAQHYGVEKSKFPDLSHDNCILCGLCVRACEEIVKKNAITFSGRGDKKSINPPFKNPQFCIACGLCEQLCPTQVIKMKTDKLETWRHNLAADQRLCRYSRMNIIEPSLCAHNFECTFCEVEQNMNMKNYPQHPLLDPSKKEIFNAR